MLNTEQALFFFLKLKQEALLEKKWKVNVPTDILKEKYSLKQCNKVNNLVKAAQ